MPQQSTLNGAAKSVNIAYDRLVRIENFLGNLTRLQQMDTRGIPLERRSYWDLMQQYGKQVELPKAKRRFHALRHAIAVHLLDAGADVAFVQDRLGHANIQNTMVDMRYTAITRDAQTRQLFASHRRVCIALWDLNSPNF